MADSGTTKRSTSRPLRNIYCSACKYPLPPTALFCPGCGPPGLPDDDPDEGLTAGQATLRIVLVFLLFTIVVVYKFDVDLSSYLPGRQSVVVPPPATPDVKVTYIVSAPQANIRESGSMDSKVILTLQKGATVVVLQKGDKWWLVQVGDRVGWVYGKRLIAAAE